MQIKNRVDSRGSRYLLDRVDLTHENKWTKGMLNWKRDLEFKIDLVYLDYKNETDAKKKDALLCRTDKLIGKLNDLMQRMLHSTR